MLERFLEWLRLEPTANFCLGCRSIAHLPLAGAPKKAHYMYMYNMYM